MLSRQTIHRLCASCFVMTRSSGVQAGCPSLRQSLAPLERISPIKLDRQILRQKHVTLAHQHSGQCRWNYDGVRHHRMPRHHQNKACGNHPADRGCLPFADLSLYQPDERQKPRLAPCSAAAAEGREDPNKPVVTPSATQQALKFLERQFLPLGLLTSLAVGYALPGPGVAAAGMDIQKFATIGIFIIQGLNLKRGEALKAANSWGSALYGLVAVLLLTPLLALPVQALPFVRPELAFGLAVFCCVPTALSSGVTLTQAVGGNTALALLMVIATNIAGIFTMPFMLAAVMRGGSSGVALEPIPLLLSLVQSILVPLMIGIAARSFVPGMARAVDANKRAVAVASAGLLCLVPWMQVSKAATSGVPLSATSIAAVAAAGAAIHLLFLAVNCTAVHLLRLGHSRNRSPGINAKADADAVRGVQRAVILVTSQKTLPVAVTVLSQLAAAGVAPGAAGLAAIPAVIAHLVQILIDSVLASRWQAADAVRDKY